MTNKTASSKTNDNMQAQNQVAKSQSTAVANLSEWQDEDEYVSPKDLLISKLLVMQGLSEKVMQGKGVFGELRDSVTNECYGSLQKPFEFVPFTYATVWIEEEFNDQLKKYKYARTIPVTAHNDNLPFEDGGIKRTRQLNFFVLAVEDLKKGNALPKMLSFKSTSRRAGQELQTQMKVTNLNNGKSPAGVVIKLTIASEKNEKQQTFAVMSIEAGRDATDAEQARALHWRKIIKQTQGGVRVDEESQHDAPHVADSGQRVPYLSEEIPF